MKRTLKQFLLLAFILLLTLSFNISSVQAAGKTKTQKKVTIYVGQTSKLKISKVPSGKAQWKSSNTKVASVTKSGKIKGLKKGKTTVSATYNNTTYKWKVTVKKPKLQKSKITLTQGDTFQIKLQGTKIKSCKSKN